jgi:hypothetical protein
VAHQLDDLAARQHLLDPEHPLARALEPGDPLAHLGADLGSVGRAGAQDELDPGVEERRGVEQVDDPLLAGDAAHEDRIGPVGIDAEALEHVAGPVRPVLVGVDPVVDHVEPRRVDGGIGVHDVAGHGLGDRDDRPSRRTPRPGRQEVRPRHADGRHRDARLADHFDAVVGPYTRSEIELSRELVGRLGPGMLVLTDRAFYGFHLWQQASSSGADLCWWVKSDLKPRHIETLSDGSWLAEARPSGNEGRKAVPIEVRVVDYSIDDGRGDHESYRLLTTILDPGIASAEELALAYAERWEIESAFDELKTHRREPRTVLRSKSPELVTQEIWGHLCCHYAIRTLMWEAAAHADEDPDRVSFVAALRIARRPVAQRGAFPPSGH